MIIIYSLLLVAAKPRARTGMMFDVVALCLQRSNAPRNIHVRTFSCSREFYSCILYDHYRRFYSTITVITLFRFWF